MRNPAVSPSRSRLPRRTLSAAGARSTKSTLRSAAAERLHPHRARARIQIQKRRALNARREHIEKGLAQPVAGGPRGQPRRGLERARTDDPAMMRIANQHTGSVSIFETVRPDPLQSIYARLVNSAGPLDGRGVARPRLFPAAGAGLPGAQRRRRLGRGLALFLVLVAAVVVRETARLLVAAWLGLRLRAILLLPIGGLFAYANPESQENANQGSGQFALALAGPLANWPRRWCWRHISGRQRQYAALRPAVDLRRPTCCAAWSGCRPAWALLHLLPAYPLDCGRLLRGSFARKHGFAPPGRAAAGMGQVLALTAMLGGMLLHNSWLIIAGFFIMIGAQIEDQGVFFQSVVDTVRMREVMLTDFATLSPSDTLADALVRCVHSLQEDFPVVRGPQLVGIVSPPAHCGRAAQRRQRLRAVGHVARLPGGAARGHAGHHHPPPHRRPRPGADSRHRERARGGHRQRAEPDEFHVAAGRAAPHRARGSSERS